MGQPKIKQRGPALKFISMDKRLQYFLSSSPVTFTDFLEDRRQKILQAVGKNEAEFSPIVQARQRAQFTRTKAKNSPSCVQRNINDVQFRERVAKILSLSIRKFNSLKLNFKSKIRNEKVQMHVVHSGFRWLSAGRPNLRSKDENSSIHF